MPYYTRPPVPGLTLSCNSSGTAIAILGASRASSLARWRRFVSIERREPLQTSLQGTLARAMFCKKLTDLPHMAVSARFVPGPSRSCNSSDTAIAIPRASRTHRLARCFAGRTPTCHAQPSAPGPTRSCNSPGTAIAILGAYRAHQLARWHRFVSIERPEPLQTSLQGISARAMVCRKITDLPRTCHTRPSEPG